MSRRLRLLLAVVVVVVPVVAGCSDPGDTASDEASHEAVREGAAGEGAARGEEAPPAVPTAVEGVLAACVAPTPDVAESVDGDWEGFDVAVLEGVAEQLGLDLEVVPSSFDEIASGVALNGGACDVAAAGVVDHEALDAVARTTTGYRTVHRLVVTTTPTPGTVAPDEVTGRVGIEDGGVAVDASDALTAAEVVGYPSQADLGRALAEGAVDAAVVSVPGRSEVQEAVGSELSLLATVPTDDETVLLLPLAAADELLEAVDGALETLREAGSLEAWRDQWLRG